MSFDSPAKQHRIERHLMRQRGAGARTVNAEFGFSFAGFSAPSSFADPPEAVPATARDEPATKRRKVAKQDGEARGAVASEQAAAIDESVKPKPRARRKFVVDEDVDVGRGKRTEAVDDSFVVGLGSRRAGKKDNAVVTVKDVSVGAGGAKKGRRGGKKQTVDLETEEGEDDLAGQNAAVEPKRKTAARPKKPVTKPKKPVAKGRKKTVLHEDEVEADAPEPDIGLAEDKPDALEQDGEVFPTERVAPGPSKRRGAKIESSLEEEPGIPLEPPDHEIQTLAPARKSRKRTVTQPTVGSDTSAVVKKTRRKGKTPALANADTEPGEEVLPVKQSRNRKVSSPLNDEVDEVEKGDEAVVTEEEPAENSRKAKTAASRKNTKLQLDGVAPVNISPQSRNRSSPLGKEDEEGEDRFKVTEAAPAKTSRKKKVAACPADHDSQPNEAAPAKRSRKRKEASPIVDHNQRESDVAGESVPVKKARKSVRDEKEARLESTPPKLGRRPLQETDVNRSPLSRRSPDRKLRGGDSRQDLDAGRRNSPCVHNALDDNLTESKETNTTSTRQAKKKAKPSGPTTSTANTRHVHTELLALNPAAAHLNSSQPENAEEDVDWLFAPAMSRPKSKAKSKATGASNAAKADQSRKTSGRRKSKMADIDLDDLLANVATFAKESRPTAKEVCGKSMVKRGRKKA